MELGVLRHERLDEERRAFRIEPRPEPVGDHLHRVGGNVRCVEIVGQRVPVGDEVVAVQLDLQRYPVRQGPQVIAQVDLAARSHPRQHALLTRSGHQPRMLAFWRSHAFTDRMST